MNRDVVITGLGAAIPGVDSVGQLLDLAAAPAPDEWALEPRIGRKGWRYKDRATRLALAAAKEALDAAGPGGTPHTRERTGVIASGNLGNLDTVCRVAAQLKAGRSSDTGPMDLPNASSNVVASTVAQWFGLRGANVMLCNGASSGIDALHMGAVMIRSGRVDRMLVLGVEPRTRDAVGFMQDSAREWLGHCDGLQWGEAAAAVVLEAAAADGDVPSAAVHVGRFRTSSGGGLRAAVLALASEPPALWLTPPSQYRPTRAAVQQALAGWPAETREVRDAAAIFGETYGASGVLQAVWASLWLRRSRRGWAALTSGGFAGDPYASCALHVQPQITV